MRHLLAFSIALMIMLVSAPAFSKPTCNIYKQKKQIIRIYLCTGELKPGKALQPNCFRHKLQEYLSYHKYVIRSYKLCGYNNIALRYKEMIERYFRFQKRLATCLSEDVDYEKLKYSTDKIADKLLENKTCNSQFRSEIETELSKVEAFIVKNESADPIQPYFLDLLKLHIDLSGNISDR